MANSYFQFKQFTIQQDQCAMKVSTDACLQGSWTPIAECVSDVLDVGTGTGLLSLMLAQRSETIQIDAVELDEAATQQAKENVASSPWKDRVKLINADIRSYSFRKQYDLVICNPPFFSNSLLGETDSRNLARHTVSLSQLDLLSVLNRVLKADGYASILLPVAQHATWAKLIEDFGWNINRRLDIHHKSNSSVNRIVSLCSRKPTEKLVEERLILYMAPSQYSAEATELLKPFYLKL